MTRVLLIEDDDLVRATLRDALESNGYEVATATNGLDGLERFRSAPADVVVTDILMPEKEGIETIIELRRDHPEVKIIAISGVFIAKSKYLKSATESWAAVDDTRCRKCGEELSETASPPEA